MVNFARSDRAAGLVHYPRVGRSDLPISNVNFNGDMEPDQDFQFYNEHDAGLDLPVDLDYEGAGCAKQFGAQTLCAESPANSYTHAMYSIRIHGKSDETQARRENSEGPIVADPQSSASPQGLLAIAEDRRQ